MLGNPGLTIGIIGYGDYEFWKHGRNNTNICVYYPKSIQFLTSTPNSINMVLQPFHPIKSEQAVTVITPTFIEIVGEIVVVDNNVTCNGNPGISSLFESYKDSVNQWRAEISGLVIPTLKDNIIGLNAKKEQ